MADRFNYFPNTELIKEYRVVFGGKLGMSVLTHMLFELGLFDDAAEMGAEGIALKNYASRLLSIIGGGEVRQTALEAMLKQLVLQPLPKKAEE